MLHLRCGGHKNIAKAWLGLRDERVGLSACASRERTRAGLLCFCASIATGFIGYPAAPPFYAMVTCLIFLGVCAGRKLLAGLLSEKQNSPCESVMASNSPECKSSLNASADLNAVCRAFASRLCITQVGWNWTYVGGTRLLITGYSARMWRWVASRPPAPLLLTWQPPHRYHESEAKSIQGFNEAFCQGESCLDTDSHCKLHSNTHIDGSWGHDRRPARWRAVATLVGRRADRRGTKLYSRPVVGLL